MLGNAKCDKAGGVCKNKNSTCVGGKFKDQLCEKLPGHECCIPNGIYFSFEVCLCRFFFNNNPLILDFRSNRNNPDFLNLVFARLLQEQRRLVYLSDDNEITFI